MNEQQTLVIAHRGFSKKYPENTLAAFEAAIAAGADMIELDLTLSADGEFVVIHDDTLDRTTDASGLVCEQPLAQLQALDAGKGFGGVSGDTGIPTLTRLLEQIAPQIALNIEIKPFFALDQAEDFQLALGRLIEELHRRHLLEQVLLSSFNFFVLRWLRAEDQRLRLAFLYTRVMTELDPVWACRQVNAEACNPQQLEASRDLIEQLHAAGLKCYPYTVNDTNRMRQLLAMGSDGLFTDVPDVMRQVLSTGTAS
ncbi:MAG: glycerophosphodiester phosphodiesterase [Nevskiales bacterium]